MPFSASMIAGSKDLALSGIIWHAFDPAVDSSTGAGGIGVTAQSGTVSAVVAAAEGVHAPHVSVVGGVRRCTHEKT